MIFEKSFHGLNSMDKGGYSFVNPSSLLHIENSKKFKLHYFSDGMLFSFLLSVFKAKVNRISFDDTSIAPAVFKECEENRYKVYIKGATDYELDLFIQKLEYEYPNLEIVGYENGFTESWDCAIRSCVANADLVVVGLGAGLQESFMYELLKKGFGGWVFSCGGYIRQKASASDAFYYPKWVNKYNIRFIYRMIKEPHTIKRYFFEYPRGILVLLGKIRDVSVI